MKRLQINSDFADLGNDPIAINWQYLDITNLKKRWQPFSSSLTLPYTPDNKKIFGYGDVTGADMTEARGIQDISLWFDAIPVVDKGTIQLQKMSDKGYQSSINSVNSLITDIDSYKVENLMDQDLDITFGNTWANAVTNLRQATDGWLLARDMYYTTQIVDASWRVYDGTDTGFIWKHWLWCSLERLLEIIETVSSCSIKFAESGSIVSLSSSTIATTVLRKMFTPGFKYHVLRETPAPNDFILAKSTTVLNSFEFGNNDFRIDQFDMFGNGSGWDLIKTIADLFNMIIYTDVNNAEVVFVPLNEIDSFSTSIDLTDKFIKASKLPNIPNYESSSFVRYKATDNIAKTFNEIEITAPKQPEKEKEILQFNIMVPGLYYNSFLDDDLYLMDYSKNSDLAKTPVILYQNGDTTSTTVNYKQDAVINYATTQDLEILRILDTSSYFADLESWVGIGEAFEVEAKINLYDYALLKPYMFVKCLQLGTTFYVNKITNFNPYSGKPAKLQLIKTA